MPICKHCGKDIYSQYVDWFGGSMWYHTETKNRRCWGYPYEEEAEAT